MAKTVADQMVEVLAAAQVERICGIVGDSLNGFTDALRRHMTSLHGSAGGRSPAVLSWHYGRRTYSGRPSSSIRFSALTAIATSVARRRAVRDRRPLPMTRLKRLMSASTRARQL